LLEEYENSFDEAAPMAELGLLEHMQVFTAGQYLSSSIPSEFPLLSNLEELQLHEHLLRGSIPASFFDKMTKLGSLSLQHNFPNGTISAQGSRCYPNCCIEPSITAHCLVLFQRSWDF